MPIDFFTGICQDGATPSQDITSAVKFGICDDIPRGRAYTDEIDSSKWIAEVDNPNAYTVTFTSIDNCIDIRRPDGNLDNRCDGMLTYEQSVVFVELKERDTDREWVAKGELQLRATITVFSNSHDSTSYLTRRAYVANSLRPNFASGRAAQMDKFKDDTGFTMLIQNRIELS